MTETTFKVKTETFEGPLELLLELIERRKLHVSDVSLAAVADDYIRYIGQFERLPIRDTAHFILIASTLLLIKSKALLPTLELSTEEEANIHDLERRLKIYKRMRTLSRHIEEQFGKNILFPPEDAAPQELVFAPHASLSVTSLYHAAQGLIAAFPKAEKLSQVVVETVMSLEEMIENLAARIKTNIKMSFKEFAALPAQAGSGEVEDDARARKVTLVVSFLAMLELVKQGVVAVQQHSLFDEIEMETQETSVPNYS